MNTQDTINQQAYKNYSTKNPWPESDAWHDKTYQCIYNFVTKQLKNYDRDDAIILNAGSGGTVYPHRGQMIHLDIIESYINNFENSICKCTLNLKNKPIDRYLFVFSLDLITSCLII